MYKKTPVGLYFTGLLPVFNFETSWNNCVLFYHRSVITIARGKKGQRRRKKKIVNSITEASKNFRNAELDDSMKRLKI